MNAVPPQPKVYHIAHVDRLPSIVATDGLLSNAMVRAWALGGTMIGMNHIKQRRLSELQLASHSGLFVGACVPFYFCPRELAYQGGQASIIHVQADLDAVVAWANARKQQFTSRQLAIAEKRLRSHGWLSPDVASAH